MHHNTDLEWLARECSKADSFADLVPIALTELQKFGAGAEVVCGPISTGGRGSLEKNFEVFGATIKGLQREGRPIFSQVPYEERIFFFRTRWQQEDLSREGQYYMPILTEFYHPLIRSGLIKAGHFIPGWESSFGARWERTELKSMGAKINDLTNNWIDEIFKAA